MEKKFKLCTKSGETIKMVQSKTLKMAVEFFSIIKNLKRTQLLKIFKVVEVK